MSNAPLSVVDEKVDEVRLFMFFVLFGGDTKRVATVSQVDVSRIESLAHDFNWKSKLNGRGSLDTAKGQDAERVLNRITNYVAAERLKRVYGRLIDELDSDPEFAKKFCTAVDDAGITSVNTKNLVELSKGLQLCQDMGYRALQDTQAQAAELVNGAADLGALALSTYKALANRFDRIAAVDVSLEVVKATNDANTQTNKEAP